MADLVAGPRALKFGDQGIKYWSCSNKQLNFYQLSPSSSLSLRGDVALSLCRKLQKEIENLSM